MTTTTQFTPSTSEPVLHVSMELGTGKWKLAFSTGLGQKPRERNVAGGHGEALLNEIRAAKKRFGLAPEARVVCCYEAGPDGFALYRFLIDHAVECLVVDSSSIEVNRRKRRKKTDKLDARALLRLLIRHVLGEERVFRVVHVPSVEAEDRRQLHRELAALIEDRTRIRNRVRGLLKSQGVRMGKGREWEWKTLGQKLSGLRYWDGRELGKHLMDRIHRELERLGVIQEQIASVEKQMAEEIKSGGGDDRAVAMMRRLMRCKPIGVQSARVLVMELFGWRDFKNRKQVGGCVGFDATPYQSGESNHEQGISKAGNVWVRRVLIQLAWSWVRLQPESELTKWFKERFAEGGKHQRRRGIVAVARKLLIALWRYVQGGDAPMGAVLRDAQRRIGKLAA